MKIKVKDLSPEGQEFYKKLMNAKTQEEGDRIVEERKKEVISGLKSIDMEEKIVYGYD